MGEEDDLDNLLRGDQWTPDEIKAFGLKEPYEFIRIPVFREALVNVDTPDEMIVSLANDKVFKINRAYGPITRWLLNTGWFDGKEEK